MVDPIGFTIFINGEDMIEQLEMTGADPFYSFIWNPLDPGFYNIRVFGSTVDGVKMTSKVLNFEIFNDPNNKVQLLSFGDSAASDDNQDQTLLLDRLLRTPFQVYSPLGKLHRLRPMTMASCSPP